MTLRPSLRPAGYQTVIFPVESKNKKKFVMGRGQVHINLQRDSQAIPQLQKDGQPLPFEQLLHSYLMANFFPNDSLSPTSLFFLLNNGCCVPSF